MKLPMRDQSVKGTASIFISIIVVFSGQFCLGFHPGHGGKYSNMSPSLIITSQFSADMRVGTKLKSHAVVETEELQELTKESFYCLRSSGYSDCIVECKRRDGKPLGCSISDEDVDFNRRAFAFSNPPAHSDIAGEGPILVHVREIPFSYGKLGGQIWYAAVGFAQYVASNPSLVRGKTVLELGAGLGLPGLVAGKVGGLVTLSEFGYEGKVGGTMVEKADEKRLVPSALLDNLKYNINLNNASSTVNVRHLDWYDYVNDVKATEKEEQYDLIIGSDLINWEDDVAPLISTLKYFLSRKEGSQAVIAMTNENRRGLPKFLEMVNNVFVTVAVEEKKLVHFDEHPLLFITLSM